MNKNELYKRFKLNAQKAKAGDLMRAMNKRKSEGKGMPKLKHKTYSEADMGSVKGYDPTGGLGNKMPNSMAKPAKQGIGAAVGAVVKPSPKPGFVSPSNFPVGKGSADSTKMMAKKMPKAMCKSCMKSHEKGKHIKHSSMAVKGLEKFAREEASEKKSKKMKSVKLVPPSKGHAPKGARGRAAVKQLGRTKTTGNFARIEKAKGKGAAISAFQNARKAKKGKKK